MHLRLPGGGGALLLFGWKGYTTAAIAASLLGFAVGGEVDVLAYMASRYFGMARFGTFFAVVSVSGSIGVALGPWLGSLAFDAMAITSHCWRGRWRLRSPP